MIDSKREKWKYNWYELFDGNCNGTYIVLTLQ